MVKAIRLHATGGTEVLHFEDIEVPDPAASEVRIRQTWAGINFVDTYHRTGLYPLPTLPVSLGVEAAGVVEALGDGVTGLRLGQRVAWAGLPVGGYAQARNIPAHKLVSLPEDITDQAAAAMLLRGATAYMLLHKVRIVGPGDVLLVHAAAGGLGQILTRWGKQLGATVIGVAGGAHKVSLAKAAGADAVIDRLRDDFVSEVQWLTEGRGVDIVYDGVGGDTLLRNLDCVRPFGTIISVGQSSGSLPTIPLTELGPRRSLSIARPSVFGYLSDPDAYRVATAAVLTQLQHGMPVSVGQVFSLAEAAEGHRVLEAGDTTGSLLLNLS